VIDNLHSSRPVSPTAARSSAARPLGGLEQATQPQSVWLLFSPSINPCNRRCRPLLAAQHSLEAFFHQLLPDPVKPSIALVSSALIIRLSLQPPPAFRHIGLQPISAPFRQPLRRALALAFSASSCSRSSPLSRTTYFFIRNVLRSHDLPPPHRCDHSES